MNEGPETPTSGWTVREWGPKGGSRASRNGQPPKFMLGERALLIIVVMKCKFLGFGNPWEAGVEAKARQAVCVVVVELQVRLQVQRH